MADPTHYEVLGVARDATGDAVHKAYLDAARHSHPDRNAEAGAADDMARINEAWRVLGHPGRRRQYDRELRGERPYLGDAPRTNGSGPTSAGVDPDDDLVDVAPGEGHSLFAFLPWLLVGGALVVIFIFTAYAATGGGSADPTGEPRSRLGQCIVITSGRPTVAPIDCAAGNDGQVVAEVDPGEACPVDTRQLVVPGEAKLLCLAG